VTTIDNDGIFINRQLIIPFAEVAFRFGVSSGPGGQHVNKTETQVTLLFDVQASPSLDEAARQRLLEKLAPRLDKNGVLQLSVQESRSQHQNREIALARFQQIVAAALHRDKPRRPTKPSRAAQERRLAAKKQRGQLKKIRRLPPDQ
jgi:ribosome-associated protein